MANRNTETSLVSIIVPTYNNEKYIAETLDSIFAQSYKNIEVILVDDGSTDLTQEVIAPYLKKIQYNYQQNQGVAVARNVALDMASGEYVAFLDGDDIWEADNLAIKVGVLAKRHDLGGVFSDFSVFNEEGFLHKKGTKKIFGVFKRRKKKMSEILNGLDTVCLDNDRKIVFHSGKIFDDLFMGNFILPSTMVVRREYADSIGRFEPHLRTQQDYEYWLRFSRKYQFGYVDDVLVRYRRHSQQLTNFTNIRKIITNVLEIVDGWRPEFETSEQLSWFNRRKAGILSELAKVNLRLNKNEDARHLLLESLQLDPKVVQTYLLFVLSYLPSKVVHKIAAIYKMSRNVLK